LRFAGYLGIILFVMGLFLVILGYTVTYYYIIGTLVGTVLLLLGLAVLGAYYLSQRTKSAR